MKIEIGGKAVNEHKSVKYLGILIDCHLYWKEHIQQLSKKISRGIGVLCKIRHYVNAKILTQLYHAIILPFFFILLYSLSLQGFLRQTVLGS